MDDTAPDFIPDKEAAPDFIPDEKPQEKAPDFIPDKPEEPQQPISMGQKFANFMQPGVNYAEQHPNLGMEMGMGAGAAKIGGLPLASFGKRFLKGAIEGGAMQYKDEVDKASLGHGDPTSSVASRMVGSILTGGAIEGLIGQRPETAASELKAIQASKLGQNVSDFLTGMGHNAVVEDSELRKIIPEYVKNKNAFKYGQYLQNTLREGLIPAVVGKTASLLGVPLEYSIGGFGLTYGLEHLFGKKISATVRNRLAPMIFKAASSDIVKNPEQILEHAAAITKGDREMTRAIDYVFQEGTHDFTSPNSDKKRESLKKFVEDGGPLKMKEDSVEKPDGFAKGGQVKPGMEVHDEIATHWPEQHLMLSTAKGRIHGYLNSVRPTKNPAKLPYDAEHINPVKERQYQHTLDLANNPLSILKRIKTGDLTPKHMADFVGMYPEIHQELSKRLGQKIADRHVNEEKKPSYKTRQALSLFLGSNLDSTLSQPNILAAQQVFAVQKAQMQQNMAKSQASLNKVAQKYETPQQGAQERLNKN